MALRYAVVAILAVAVTTFTLQNTAPTRVRFLVWTIDAVPVAGLVLLAVAAGLIIAGMPLLFARVRYRSRLRALETRVSQLQARDTQAPGQLPPDPHR